MEEEVKKEEQYVLPLSHMVGVASNQKASLLGAGLAGWTQAPPPPSLQDEGWRRRWSDAHTHLPSTPLFHWPVESLPAPSPSLPAPSHSRSPRQPHLHNTLLTPLLYSSITAGSSSRSSSFCLGMSAPL